MNTIAWPFPKGPVECVPLTQPRSPYLRDNAHVVFRIETPDGTGPYFGQSGMSTDSPGRNIDSNAFHPMPGPSWDPMLSAKWRELQAAELDQRYIHGFDSVEQLLAWFNGRRVHFRLADASFRVAVYLTEHRFVGTCQVLFQRKASHLIGHVPFDVLYRMTTARKMVEYLEACAAQFKAMGDCWDGADSDYVESVVESEIYGS